MFADVMRGGLFIFRMELGRVFTDGMQRGCLRMGCGEGACDAGGVCRWDAGRVFEMQGGCLQMGCGRVFPDGMRGGCLQMRCREGVCRWDAEEFLWMGCGESISG